MVLGVDGDLEALLGWDDDLIGEFVTTLIPFKMREAHLAAFESYAETGHKKAMGSWLNVDGRHRDHSLIPILLCVTERDGLLEGLIESRE